MTSVAGGVYRRLLDAAVRGDSERLRGLLVDYSGPSHSHDVVLYHAVREHQTESVRLLLADGRAQCGNRRGDEMLSRAVEDGETHILRMLLQHFVPPPDLLLTCAHFGRTSCLAALLVDDRADPAWRDSQSLVSAVVYNRLGIVRLLLDDGRADPCARRCLCMVRAARLGRLECAFELLREGRCWAPAKAITTAAKRGDLEMLRLLVSDDQSEVAAGAIVSAAAGGHLECVRFLAAGGRADPAFGDNAALERAARHNDAPMVRLLLELVDPSESDAIPCAAEFGCVSAAGILLLDGRARVGDALERAVDGGFVRMTELLLVDGRADPTVRDSLLVCYAASVAPASAILSLFLADERVDPAATNSLALQVAAERGNLAAVALLLLDGRSDPSANGFAAVKYAAVRGDAFMVYLFLWDAQRRQQRHKGPIPVSYRVPDAMQLDD